MKKITQRFTLLLTKEDNESINKKLTKNEKIVYSKKSDTAFEDCYIVEIECNEELEDLDIEEIMYDTNALVIHENGSNYFLAYQYNLDDIKDNFGFKGSGDYLITEMFTTEEKKQLIKLYAKEKGIEKPFIYIDDKTFKSLDAGEKDLFDMDKCQILVNKEKEIVDFSRVNSQYNDPVFCVKRNVPLSSEDIYSY